ncbi:MAG: hypothetical protein JST73_08280 [Actinobacteria bacterium]|nr:hypothetical protein [Actinomycetota bacterium]
MSSRAIAAPAEEVAPRFDRGSLGAAVLAASAAGIVLLTAWHGGDLSGQIYREDITRSFGVLLWDTWWYTGHYVASYSFLSPPVSALLGLPLAAMAAAVVSAWSFDRLLRARAATYGKARVDAASAVFAVGTAAPILIGQVTFLMGEAVGLTAVLAAAGRRKVLAVVLACVTTMFSPVAGIFVAVALGAMLLAEPVDRAARSVALAATAAPLVVSLVLFGKSGAQPFLVGSLAVVLASCLVGWFFLPSTERVIRFACVIYGVGAIATFLVPNPLGGNIVRLAGCVAAPIAIVMVRPDRRKVVAVGVVGMIVWQWTPAVSGLISSSGDPSRHEAYFTPLVTELETRAQPERVEIPFTRQHWEAAYVAPHIPLARGWERQTDRADNPIFYSRTPITAAAYHAWLDDNGVRWVALPDVALDYSSKSEAALIRRGLPYLHLEWSNAHWKLWKVLGSPGLVDGPATLSMPAPDSMVLDVTRPGSVLVRVRFTPAWHVVAGRACLSASPDGWTQVQAIEPGRIELVAQPGLTSYDCPSRHPQRSRHDRP